MFKGTNHSITRVRALTSREIRRAMNRKKKKNIQGYDISGIEFPRYMSTNTMELNMLKQVRQ